MVVSGLVRETSHPVEISAMHKSLCGNKLPCKELAANKSHCGVFNHKQIIVEIPVINKSLCEEINYT